MPDDSDLDPRAIARLRRLGGDRLLREMLRLFLQHAPGSIAAAVAAHRDGDLRGVEQAVHSLKSSAGNVGARAVQELAGTVEQLAESAQSAEGPRAEQIGPRLHDLQSALERILPHLEHLKEGRDP